MGTTFEIRSEKNRKTYTPKVTCNNECIFVNDTKNSKAGEVVMKGYKVLYCT